MVTKATLPLTITALLQALAHLKVKSSIYHIYSKCLNRKPKQTKQWGPIDQSDKGLHCVPVVLYRAGYHIYPAIRQGFLPLE